LADPDPWRNELRAAFGRPLAEAAATLKKQAGDAATLERRPAASLVLLANLLHGAGEGERSVAVLRAAWRRFPGDFWVNFYLGMSSWSGGHPERPEEAVRFLTAAVAAQPGSAAAHTHLGTALRKQGKAEEAIACFRRAIQIDPDLAMAHGALGWALLEQGKFAEAQASADRCLKLLPAGHPMRPVASWMLQQCRRWLALEKKLPDVLAGRRGPLGPRKQVEYAQLCLRTRRWQAAARLYARAFAAEAKLADDLGALDRYNAACCAALAGCGQGKDAATLGEVERARWRRQALTWLRADLVARARQLQAGSSGAAAQARRALLHWQKDPDLAGLRDEGAIARLPAEERPACRKLWADVEALLKTGPQETK
jgi:tetratricopeptide (TPR) repeat protein